jgi:hypothetical protein
LSLSLSTARVVERHYAHRSSSEVEQESKEMGNLALAMQHDEVESMNEV